MAQHKPDPAWEKFDIGKTEYVMTGRPIKIVFDCTLNTEWRRGHITIKLIAPGEIHEFYIKQVHRRHNTIIGDFTYEIKIDPREPGSCTAIAEYQGKFSEEKKFKIIKK